MANLFDQIDAVTVWKGRLNKTVLKSGIKVYLVRNFFHSFPHLPNSLLGIEFKWKRNNYKIISYLYSAAAQQSLNVHLFKDINLQIEGQNGWWWTRLAELFQISTGVRTMLMLLVI